MLIIYKGDDLNLSLYANTTTGIKRHLEKMQDETRVQVVWENRHKIYDGPAKSARKWAKEALESEVKSLEEGKHALQKEEPKDGHLVSGFRICTDSNRGKPRKRAYCRLAGKSHYVYLKEQPWHFSEEGPQAWENKVVRDWIQRQSDAIRRDWRQKHGRWCAIVKTELAGYKVWAGSLETLRFLLRDVDYEIVVWRLAQETETILHEDGFYEDVYCGPASGLNVLDEDGPNLGRLIPIPIN